MTNHLIYLLIHPSTNFIDFYLSNPLNSNFPIILPHYFTIIPLPYSHYLIHPYPTRFLFPKSFIITGFFIHLKYTPLTIIILNIILINFFLCFNQCLLFFYFK